ncbi:MAG: hypothetical protein ACWA6X_12100 [Bauldia sp.]
MPKLWNAARQQPFQIAPWRPGDGYYDPTAWVRESPQYQSWDERWDTFLNEVVAPVVAPIATSLPLAIPYAAHLLGGAAESAAQAVSLPYRVQDAHGGD